MAMAATDLPRVTYSNAGVVDFSGVHDRLDEVIPAFRSRRLGAEWPNVIGGRDDREGMPYDARSPIDGDIVLGAFREATPAAVARAVEAAAAAYPDWSRRSWPERVRAMRRVADALEAAKFDLAAACLLEVGKSRMEAMGEAEEGIDLVLHYCDEMERNEGFVHPMRRAFPQEETSVLLRPLGVWAVIAPFNFPLALSVNMMAGALVTGNTVVYKPSPMAGLTGALLVRAFAEAGLPAGVVNMVCGGREVGRSLIAQPALAGAAFTGSHQVGMEIFRSFSAGPFARPVVVEMGGKNPAYVTASADLDCAAAGVMKSAFGLQGQKCSACSKVYVAEAVREPFLDRLLAASDAVRVGDPEQRDVFMGPVINEAAHARFRQAMAEARGQGEVLLGGERLYGGPYDKGFYLPPTIVAGLPPEHRLHREEIFLPLLAVQDFSDLGRAIADGNRVVYGLTAGIYTRDERELDLFLDRAEAGVLYANRASGATTGAWPGVQSFCGWKGSGVAGKGGLGPHYLPLFMREQSRTVMR